MRTARSRALEILDEMSDCTTATAADLSRLSVELENLRPNSKELVDRAFELCDRLNTLNRHIKKYRAYVEK